MSATPGGEAGETGLPEDPGGAGRGDLAGLVQRGEALRALVLAAPDAVVALDREGRVTLWNPAAESIFGWTEAEVLGRRPPNVPEELREEHARLRDRVLRGEAYSNVEVERCTKRGGRVPVRLSTAPMLGPDGAVEGVMSITVDISEQRRAMERALRQQEYFRTLTENASDLVSILAVDGIILYQSPSVKRLLGYDADELIGTNALERIHPDDIARVAAELRTLARDPEARRTVTYRWLHGDGGWRTLESVGKNLLHDATVAGVVVNSRDVTDRARAEDALRRALAEAEAASRAKSEFLSSMSHELRTPLNSVIGFANVLRRNRAGRLEARELDYLDRILANGRHLLALIEDLLDLSRIEAGRVEVERDSVALDALVAATLDELRGGVPAGVRMEACLPPSVAPLETDPRRLKQILINLVGNALKFTAAGTVTVAVLTEPETAAPRCIEVVDTGIGIPADRLEAIFEAFEQGESGTARRYGGTGLGLAISSSLARLLGYRIEVESAVGRGSTFRLLLGRDQG